MVLGSTLGTVRRGIEWCATKLSSADDEEDDLAVNPSRRRVLQAGATAAAAGVGLSASSGGAAAYTPVGPELITCDLARTDDSELPWDAGGMYGGWRATEHFGVSGGGVDNTPVVFVHGNSGDACNFEEHAQYLLDSGWTGDEIYSITFREKVSSHVDMRDQLDDFVQHVLSETGSSTVSVVSHSLGVTGTRFWMDDLDRYSWIENFVGMNGGIHGVCVCPGCYDTSLDGDFNGWLEKGEACQFIAVQCFADPDHPLYELNLPDETPYDDSIDYFTVRGFFDPLFYCNPWSPYLSGADNNLIYRNHTGSLVDDTVKSDVESWCTTASETETASSEAVSWWVEANVDGYGDTYSKVKVEQNATDKDLYVSLIDPAGNEADYTWIYDYELDDGDVTVDLKMNGSDAAADTGTWTLRVEYDDGSGLFHEDTATFDDYDPLMVHDEYVYYQDSYGDYYMDRWEITIENQGDVPLYVTDVQVEIDGETDYLYPDRTLHPGDRDTYVCEDTDTWLSEGTGTYDVNFEMDVDDQLWATGTFDFTVE